MGRASLLIKSDELEGVVRTLESSNQYGSIGELCQAISESEWGKSVKNSKMRIKGISPQMVYVKIKEFKIGLVTKPGKRGRAEGAAVTKVARKDKLSKVKGMQTFAEALTKEVNTGVVPERYKRMASLAILGNARACSALVCGQCMGYSGAERACDGSLGGVPCANYPQNRLIYGNRRKFKENPDGFWETVIEKE